MVADEAVVWFRRDLRLADNPAWAAATTGHAGVIGLFVIDPRLWDRCHPRRVIGLAGHLAALDHSLRTAGGRLRVERGDPEVVVPAVARGRRVYANRDVTPFAVARDGAVGRTVDLDLFDGCWVHPPGSIRTASGDIHRVFTPFHRVWSDLAVPGEAIPGDATIATDPGLGVPDHEPATPPTDRLAAFERVVDSYHTVRDRPDLDTTSHLSVDLKYGTISARDIVRRIGTATPGRRAFVRQLAWRDFYAALLAHHPDTVHTAMRPEYDAIRWADDPEGLDRWKQGRTGFPIVDAGMRQLTAQGWQPNRVRMITASFLVKDLLIDWRLGERHFRRLLLDGDTPQNVGNWQWVAGTGADAAPYFRIFNPVTQSRRFDPTGDYIRRWVRELAHLDPPAIHAPWEHDAVPDSYPHPIVDHPTARQNTLDAYRSAQGGATDPKTP
jgi:deoxyribodipyrimidine photo-lyase